MTNLSESYGSIAGNSLFLTHKKQRIMNNDVNLMCAAVGAIHFYTFCQRREPLGLLSVSLAGVYPTGESSITGLQSFLLTKDQYKKTMNKRQVFLAER